MHIRVGYELIYECPQATPMVVTLRRVFTALSDEWSEGVRKVFRELPDLAWREPSR